MLVTMATDSKNGYFKVNAYTIIIIKLKDESIMTCEMTHFIGCKKVVNLKKNHILFTETLTIKDHKIITLCWFSSVIYTYILNT